MKKLIVVGILFVAAAMFATASWSDVAPGSANPAPMQPEGSPVPAATTAPAVPDHVPFTPYSAGPPESLVPYSALSSDEKAVVDRGRDTTGWDQVGDAFASAAAERATGAAAQAAAQQLGIEDLAGQGVVP